MMFSMRKARAGIADEPPAADEGNSGGGKGVNKPAVAAPSQYLFMDHLLEDADPEGPVRVKGRLEWILTNVNFTVGLGLLWRFPTVAYRQSGGSFVTAYIVIFVLVGYPLALLEVALGQSTRRRAATVFKLSIAFEGLSICMGLYSFIIPIYYNVIFAYAIFYLYHVFGDRPAWTKCDDVPALPGYVCVRGGVHGEGNGSLVASEQMFWQYHVLKEEPGKVSAGKFDRLNAPLVLCLAISWLTVGTVLVHRIRKCTFAMEYVLIPLMMLILLLLIVVSVACNEENIVPVAHGLRHFFTPSAEIFRNVQIWREATQQVLFSLGIASGPLITLGSVSHFRSPIHVDSAIVCVINFVFSIVSGIATFYAAAILGRKIGQMAAVTQEVDLYGSGFFFIAFSSLLGELPFPQLWSVIFFLLLICLGSRAVMGSIDTTVVVFRYFMPAKYRSKFTVQLAGLVVLCCSFLLGLSALTTGDALIFLVLDHYGGGTTLPLLAAFECIAVIWIYGVIRFSGDVEYMLDYKPNIILRIIWIGIPVYLIMVIAVSWIHEWVVYPLGNIVPLAFSIAGWMIVLFIMLPLPIFFIVNCVILGRKRRLKEIFKSRDDIGPDDLHLWFMETSSSIESRCMSREI